MEHLPTTTTPLSRGANEPLDKYIERLIKNQTEQYRQITSRINWLLERIHTESVNGTNCMVMEYIKPGQNKNDSGNWRIIITPGNDSELQENINNIWTTRGRWIGV